jgi:hypothetical protein
MKAAHMVSDCGEISFVFVKNDDDDHTNNNNIY